MSPLIRFGRTTPEEAAFVAKLLAWIFIAVGVLCTFMGALGGEYLLTAAGAALVILVILRMRGRHGAAVVVHWIMVAVWIALVIRNSSDGMHWGDILLVALIAAAILPYPRSKQPSAPPPQAPPESS